jgi:hypothetical protein
MNRSPPRRCQLDTLKHAADYIIKLPKAEQNLDNWRTAISRRAATPADVEELRIGKAGPPAHTLQLLTTPACP